MHGGGRRWGRWLLGIVGVIFLLAIVGDIVISAQRGSEPDVPAVGNPPTPVEPSEPEPVNPDDPAGGESGQGIEPTSVSRKDSPKDAANAADQAVSAVSVGYLLPEILFMQTLETMVVKESRDILLKSYRGDRAAGVPGAGESLAAIWKFNNIQDALLNAEYRIKTEKYRVESFDADAGRAVIYLYTITHFNRRVVSQNNVVLLESFFTPSINVINMQWQDGRWRYVSSPDTPASREPQISEKGLTYKEIKARYDEYVKEGYLDFS